jgi:hypothetical protein
MQKDPSLNGKDLFCRQGGNAVYFVYIDEGFRAGPQAVVPDGMFFIDFCPPRDYNKQVKAHGEALRLPLGF